MQNITSAPDSGENVWLWLLKTGSGVLILVVLGIHIVVNHFVAPGGLLTFDDVVAYYQNPLIPIMEGFFLLFVVAHSLLGVRSILLDLDIAPAAMRWISGFLIVAGVGAIGYGAWLLLAIVAYG